MTHIQRLSLKPYTSPNAPFSRNAETVMSTYADNARQTWRVLHCWPVLETGRIADLANRVYDVESTRTEGRRWRVNLETYTCCDARTGELCPDLTYNRKTRCCHIEAALVKERHLVGDNRDNRLINRKREHDCPPERTPATNRDYLRSRVA